MERDDDVCVNCGHERLEHRNWLCFAEDIDGNACPCDDPVYDEEDEPDDVGHGR